MLPSFFFLPLACFFPLICILVHLTFLFSLSHCSSAPPFSDPFNTFPHCFHIRPENRDHFALPPLLLGALLSPTILDVSHSEKGKKKNKLKPTHLHLSCPGYLRKKPAGSLDSAVGYT